MIFIFYIQHNIIIHYNMGCLPFKNLSPDDPLDGNGTLMSSEETTTHSKPSFVFSTIRISSSFLFLTKGRKLSFLYIVHIMS